jgi:hypothetical protein
MPFNTFFMSAFRAKVVPVVKDLTTETAAMQKKVAAIATAVKLAPSVVANVIAKNSNADNATEVFVNTVASANKAVAIGPVFAAAIAAAVDQQKKVAALNKEATTAMTQAAAEASVPTVIEAGIKSYTNAFKVEWDPALAARVARQVADNATPDGNTAEEAAVEYTSQLARKIGAAKVLKNVPAELREYVKGRMGYRSEPIDLLDEAYARVHGEYKSPDMLEGLGTIRAKKRLRVVR